MKIVEIESPGRCNSLCHSLLMRESESWLAIVERQCGDAVSGRDGDNLFTQRGRVSWVHRAHNACVIIWFRIYYLSFAPNTRTPSHYAFCSNIGITLTSSHLRLSVGDKLIAKIRARVENFGLKLSTKLFVACKGAIILLKINTKTGLSFCLEAWLKYALIRLQFLWTL